MNGFIKKLVNMRMAEISPYLENTSTIIDIGSGNCHLAYRLMSKGLQVTPVDVVNKSRVPEIEPVIYDGESLPFADDSFDLALLITVLHHTSNPVTILQEAKRVAKRIVIMEDLYDSTFQKYATYVMDSVLNNEYFGHPHSNKTKQEWLRVFVDLDLEVLDIKENSFWKLFKNGTFHLQK